MNEFISNSGTLINPDSVYDQERFINILQIILQKKTQKELSEQTGLNNATISRMLNGARSGRPYKSTIDKIAKAIDDPELIQEFNPYKCNECGDCIEACPYNMLHATGNEKFPIMGFCTLCGQCIDACPKHALYDV